MTPTNPAPPTEATAPPDANGHAPPSLLDEPTFEECVEQWSRYRADRDARRIDIRQVPSNTYLVYYAGRIVDHDTDATALQHRAAAALGVHPARLVLDYREVLPAIPG